MKDTVIQKLRARMNEVISAYSNHDRERNFNNETFKLATPKDFRVIGEYDACIILEKNTGKKCLFRFRYIVAKELWLYYVPVAGHVMDAKTREYYEEVECYNGQKFMEVHA